MSDSIIPSGAKSQEQALPDWASERFRRFLDANELALRLLHLSMNGIAMTRGRPKALRVLIETAPDGAEEKITDAEIAEAERAASLAEDELKRDFPLLHGQAVVALWSSLENLIIDVLRDWLTNRPETLQNVEVAKLRVTLGDFLGKSSGEHAELIVMRLQDELAAPQRRGVERFEALLRTFGLSGPVDEQVAKDIYELQQVRNVIVHRSGVVDRRFREACPWYDVPVGSELLITHGQFMRFGESVGSYVLELIQRLRVIFGLGRFVQPDPPTADRYDGL